jgi:hypothetical protein
MNPYRLNALLVHDEPSVAMFQSLYMLFMNFLRGPYAFSDVIVISGQQRRFVHLVGAYDRR